jgi:hypothetical protein
MTLVSFQVLCDAFEFDDVMPPAAPRSRGRHELEDQAAEDLADAAQEDWCD